MPYSNNEQIMKYIIIRTLLVIEELNLNLNI